MGQYNNRLVAPPHFGIGAPPRLGSPGSAIVQMVDLGKDKTWGWLPPVQILWSLYSFSDIWQNHMLAPPSLRRVGLPPRGNPGSTSDVFTSMLGSQTGTQSSCGSRIPLDVADASLASAPLDLPIDIHLKNPVSLTNHHQVNYTSVFVGFMTEWWFHTITEWIWKIKISIFWLRIINNQVNLLKLYAHSSATVGLSGEQN